MEPNFQDIQEQYELVLSSLEFKDGENIVIELFPETATKLRIDGYLVEETKESEMQKQLHNFDWSIVTNQLKAEGDFSDLDALELQQRMKAPRTEKMYRITPKK